ncbi:hypothetical protein ACIBHY_28735 [Nonomuraea sp. NPDC050547]|uniref:hypothetical protein n=1 Tax=Nonomuraea sp. NPDC050547 TaxID=3364368 RepID=UPI0037B5EF33
MGRPGAWGGAAALERAYLEACGFASEEARRAYFEKQTADWPPLSDQVRLRLRLLLRAAEEPDTGSS